MPRNWACSVGRVRMATVILGSLLTAAAVSLGGLIGFVGLLVPHFLRILIGPNHVRLLPAAALGGAIFLILADTFARTAFAPTEIPVGVFTAFPGRAGISVSVESSLAGVAQLMLHHSRIPRRLVFARSAPAAGSHVVRHREAGDGRTAGTERRRQDHAAEAGFAPAAADSGNGPAAKASRWQRGRGGSLPRAVALVPQELEAPFQLSASRRSSPRAACLTCRCSAPARPPIVEAVETCDGSGRHRRACVTAFIRSYRAASASG